MDPLYREGIPLLVPAVPASNNRVVEAVLGKPCQVGRPERDPSIQMAFTAAAESQRSENSLMPLILCR